MEEALADHGRNLENLLKRARSVILKFNKNKLRLNSTFMWSGFSPSDVNNCPTWDSCSRRKD